MPDPSASRVHDLVTAAKRAGQRLAQGSGPERRAILLAMADALERPDHRENLLAANALDVQDAQAACSAGSLDRAILARLKLDASKLDGLAHGLRQLAAQADLIGQVTLERELDDDLTLRRISCPLGVLGVVFEARPDAVPQITGLAMRTGNAVVLKGGKEARRSNAATVTVLRQVLVDQGFDADAIALIDSHQEVAELLACDRHVDLIVARGSSAFVQYVQRNTRIPVMGHASGICHMYLHHSASSVMAVALAVDSKTSYPAACNAIETLLWEPGAEAALKLTIAGLQHASVQLRGCPSTRELHPEIAEATEADWDEEYGNLTLAIRRVDNIYGAIEHIEAHGSGHTEAIVAQDPEAAATFVASVDAAGVFHNASTRFADGYRYGLGAEVGISTDKLHARGPVGAEGLITYRYVLRGHGQVTSEYGPGKRRFRHRDLRSR